jgi:intracellular sulfur oxidation DsrE/DsrF family protein
MAKQNKSRRAVLAGFGAIAAAGALGTSNAAAQASSPAPAPFTPALHDEDAWMSAVPGRHRVVVDVTSPEGVPDGLRFVGNLLTAHKSGYGVDEMDVAVIVCLRHGATPYGYTDPIWSKYGKTFDAKTAPSANPYNSGNQLQMADLAKRGVRFMVCGLASRRLAGRIAGQTGDAESVLKEFGANLVPSGRIVPAGVVGVTHAQERGFALLYVG